MSCILFNDEQYVSAFYLFSFRQPLYISAMINRGYVILNLGNLIMPPDDKQYVSGTTLFLDNVVSSYISHL